MKHQSYGRTQLGGLLLFHFTLAYAAQPFKQHISLVKNTSFTPLTEPFFRERLPLCNSRPLKAIHLKPALNPNMTAFSTLLAPLICHTITALFI